MTLESKRRPLAVAAPGIAGAVLAKLACPVCWPAIAGVFGSATVGAAYSTVGLPLGVAFLLLALGSLAYRARDRRGYGPLALGMLGATALLAGELAASSEPLALSGVGLVIVASIWNAWPRRRPKRERGLSTGR